MVSQWSQMNRERVSPEGMRAETLCPHSLQNFMLFSRLGRVSNPPYLAGQCALGQETKSTNALDGKQVSGWLVAWLSRGIHTAVRLVLPW
ncbi:hypothetical protein NBRC116187_24380 [Halopseudomonas sabulinigri]|uniref:Uncharacterized protein n=1 Tax=Halopseudomonas sabulinigri TaxID=472181 RepID=A0ABP9ZRK2_9GAMM